jgi:hypothetical protein
MKQKMLLKLNGTEKELFAFFGFNPLNLDTSFSKDGHGKCFRLGFENKIYRPDIKWNIFAILVSV